MQKDYAKHTFKQNRQFVQQGWRTRLYLVVILLSIGCFISGGYFFYKNESSLQGLTKIKSLFVEKQPKKESVKITNKQAVKNDETTIQFKFYTDLPKGGATQVVAETEPQRTEIVAPSPKIGNTHSVAIDNNKKDHYLLQVAAYKNAVAAGELRISLLLAGFEANLVKSMTNEHKPLYLIQLGPYPSLAEAKVVQQNMKQKGIESVVKKMV